MPNSGNDHPNEVATVAVAEGPSGRGPLHYLREAIKVARFDGEAIARVSQDRQALVYGAGIVAIGALPAVLWRSASGPVGDSPGGLGFSGITGGLAWILLQVMASAAQIAVIHGVAKLLFDATGTYAGVLRVMWLGSIVSWLAIVPVLGSLVAGVWFLIISLVTFEEVDGVERLQGLILVVGLAAIMFLLSLMLASPVAR